MPQLGLDSKQNSVLPGIQIKSKPEPDCVFPKKEWTVMSSVLICFGRLAAVNFLHGLLGPQQLG